MKARLPILVSCLAALSGFAQGFVNLDFESTTVGFDPTPRPVPFASAFPGWIGYYSGANQATTAGYNQLSLGTSSFAIVDQGAPAPISIFHYTALLFAGSPGFQSDVSLAQTGLVPGGSMSLHFFAGGDSGFLVMLNGQPVSPTILQDFGSYREYGADISAFAGQTAELRFTRPAVQGGRDFELDNISFSATPVPEPSTWALLALGSALFARAARRRRSFK